MATGAGASPSMLAQALQPQVGTNPAAARQQFIPSVPAATASQASLPMMPPRTAVPGVTGTSQFPGTTWAEAAPMPMAPVAQKATSSPKAGGDFPMPMKYGQYFRDNREALAGLSPQEQVDQYMAHQVAAQQMQDKVAKYLGGMGYSQGDRGSNELYMGGLF